MINEAHQEGIVTPAKKYLSECFMKLQGKHIFVIEDNAGNLAIASIYLEREGAKLSHLRWGYKAVASLRAALPIDAILMDLMLPGQLSGFDIFQLIQQEEALAHIPVLAVSASDPDMAIPRLKAAGFSGFVPKPVSYRLAGHVLAVIEGKAVWVADPTDSDED